MEAAAVLVMTAMASLPAAQADEAQAKALFKAMSDYLSAQKTLSYEYDTTLEIVTKEKQKLGLASSGSVTLHRPDKIRATRSGGFAHVEVVFDGKTLSLLGKHANQYVQADMPGTIDHLVDVLRDKFHRPLAGSGPADVGCLSAAHASGCECEGSWQRGDPWGGMRSSRFPDTGGGLADLDCPGRPALSLPLRGHQHEGDGGAAIQHRYQGMENGRRGRVRRFQLHGADGRHQAEARRSSG